LCKGQLEFDLKNAIYAEKHTIYAKLPTPGSFFVKIKTKILSEGGGEKVEAPEEKRYTNDGCLIVSELGRCPFFEKDEAARRCNSEDCFYCKFSDFRKREYIERIESESRKGVLYSVCHNEKNKKTT
jgi:hypothetical protein